jgi:hypothetical protein
MVQITRRQVVSTTLSEPELKALEIWCTRGKLETRDCYQDCNQLHASK